MFSKGYEGGLAAYCAEALLSRDDDRVVADPKIRDPAFEIPILRKEVIQPQVPLRLPCYDFTPVAEPTVAGCPRS